MIRIFCLDVRVNIAPKFQAEEVLTVAVVRLVACSPLLNLKHRAFPWDSPAHQVQTCDLPSGVAADSFVPVRTGWTIGNGPAPARSCRSELAEYDGLSILEKSQSRVKWPGWWQRRHSFPNFKLTGVACCINKHSRKIS